MNQGCVNEGADTRFLGWLVCPLQRLLSFKRAKPPKVYGKLPYFGITLIPYMIVQIPLGKRWLLYRASWLWIPAMFFIPWWAAILFMFLAWRYDANWKGFIVPAVALKLTKGFMEKGY